MLSLFKFFQVWSCKIKCYWCKNRFSRKEMKIHKRNCELKRIVCEYCHKMIICKNKLKHLSNSCDEYRILEKCRNYSGLHYDINDLKPTCISCENKIDLIIDVKVCKKCKKINCDNCITACDICDSKYCYMCFKTEKNFFYYWFLRHYKMKICIECLSKKCNRCEIFPINPNLYSDYCHICRDKQICKYCLKDCLYCNRKICGICSDYCYMCDKYYCHKSNDKSNILIRGFEFLVNNLLCLHNNNCFNNK